MVCLRALNARNLTRQTTPLLWAIETLAHTENLFFLRRVQKLIHRKKKEAPLSSLFRKAMPVIPRIQCFLSSSHWFSHFTKRTSICMERKVSFSTSIFYLVFFMKVFLQRQDFSFLQCDFEAFCFLLQALNSRWSFSFYLRKIIRRKEIVRKKVGQWRFERSFLFWKRRRNWCVIEFCFIYFSFYFFFTSFEKWLKKLNV